MATPAGFEPATFSLEGCCCLRRVYDRFAFRFALRFAFPTVLSIRKSSSFFAGAFVAATSHRGVAPRPAQNSAPASACRRAVFRYRVIRLEY